MGFGNWRRFDNDLFLRNGRLADWYDFLTSEFKLPREAYTVDQRAVFHCPRCGSDLFVRIDHAKEKIRKLGTYECSTCRKVAGAARSRSKIKPIKS